MAVYSISDVEKLTGVRAPTLRAWEQRHGLLDPDRGVHNTRHYHDEDIGELFRITLLKSHGYRIGQISAMPPAERSRRVAALSNIEVGPDVQLDALTLATLRLDDYRLSLMLDTNIAQRGLEETMFHLIYPFLEKLGVLYFTGAAGTAHEKFVAALIRQKILAATDDLPPVLTGRVSSFGIFLPDGERRQLSSLFLQYILRSRGYAAVYLGSGMGAGELARIISARHFDYLLSILSGGYAEKSLSGLVGDILAHCPDVTLLLTGKQADRLDLRSHPRARKLSGLQEVVAFANLLSKRANQNIGSRK